MVSGLFRISWKATKFSADFSRDRETVCNTFLEGNISYDYPRHTIADINIKTNHQDCMETFSPWHGVYWKEEDTASSDRLIKYL